MLNWYGFNDLIIKRVDCCIYSTTNYIKCFTGAANSSLYNIMDMSLKIFTFLITSPNTYLNELSITRKKIQSFFNITVCYMPRKYNAIDLYFFHISTSSE